MFRRRGGNRPGVSAPVTNALPQYPRILGRHTADDLRNHRIRPFAAASERFFSDFPNGEFYQMDTDSVDTASGRNLMCGFFAIINSFLDRWMYDQRVRIPTFNELSDVLRGKAARRFRKFEQPVPKNNFAADELRIILQEWVKKYWRNSPWGGVELGIVSPMAREGKIVPQLPVEASDPAPSGLPKLVIWISNFEEYHWEGVAQVPPEKEEQMLPQLDHHTLPVRQSTLPSGGIQPQQYPQQPPMAFPSPPAAGDSDPFLGCSNNPLPVRRLRSLTPDELYKARTLHKLGLEMKVEALKRAYGISSTPPPAPSSYAGLWLEPAQEFPPSNWMTPVTPIPQLVPIPYRPPGSLIWTGLGPAPESLYPPNSFAPTPDPPLFLPYNQSRQQGQSQRGGSQAPTSQPPISRAPSRKRILNPKPEDNEGQKEEGRKEKTYTRKKGKDKLPRRGA